MVIELLFVGAPGGLKEAVADIRIQDVGEADAPARTLASQRVEGFSVESSVVLETDLKAPPGERNLSVFVKVEAVDTSRAIKTFLSTTTTPLPDNPAQRVRVVLESIV